jgi:hypothetical protein
MTWKCALVSCAPGGGRGEGELTVPTLHWSMGPYGAHHTSEKHASPPTRPKIGYLSKCLAIVK